MSSYVFIAVVTCFDIPYYTTVQSAVWAPTFLFCKMRPNVLFTKCVFIPNCDLAKPFENPWVYLHSGNQLGEFHKGRYVKKNGSSKEHERVNQMSCQCIAFISFIMFALAHTHTRTHTEQ